MRTYEEKKKTSLKTYENLCGIIKAAKTHPSYEEWFWAILFWRDPVRLTTKSRGLPSLRIATHVHAYTHFHIGNLFKTNKKQRFSWKNKSTHSFMINTIKTKETPLLHTRAAFKNNEGACGRAQIVCWCDAPMINL